MREEISPGCCYHPVAREELLQGPGCEVPLGLLTMLLELDIHNLAIAHDVHVSFDNGLNVITGETGAGKTILVRAISAVLGGKPVSYTHLRANETRHDLVCRLLLEKKKKKINNRH